VLIEYHRPMRPLRLDEDAPPFEVGQDLLGVLEPKLGAELGREPPQTGDASHEIARDRGLGGEYLMSEIREQGPTGARQAIDYAVAVRRGNGAQRLHRKTHCGGPAARRRVEPGSELRRALVDRSPKDRLRFLFREGKRRGVDLQHLAAAPQPVYRERRMSSGCDDDVKVLGCLPADGFQESGRDSLRWDFLEIVDHQDHVRRQLLVQRRAHQSCEGLCPCRLVCVGTLKAVQGRRQRGRKIRKPELQRIDDASRERRER
jgi:hypothetical protein